MKRFLAALAAGVLTLGLCSFGFDSLKAAEPKIRYEKFEVNKVTLQDTSVSFHYTVDNPNPLGLDNIGADYELWLGEKEVPQGQPATLSGKDVKFSVKAKSVSPFVLPMTVNYEGFFHSAGELAKVLATGQKTIPFTLKTVFHLDLTILKFSIPITTSGDLPLPEVSPVGGITLPKFP